MLDTFKADVQEMSRDEICVYDNPICKPVRPS